MAAGSQFFFLIKLYVFLSFYKNSICLHSSSQAENCSINVILLSFCLSLWDIGTETQPAMTSGSPSDPLGEPPLEYAIHSSTPDLQKGMV